MTMNDVPLPEDKTLLIVDDDRPFRERLARAMQTRGFDVAVAETVREGIAMASLYDIMRFPAIMAIALDGTLLHHWEGEQLPLIDEVASYLSHA